jgi:C4-dicarboxylate-specific signal transduction histidine kinase
VLHNVGNVLNSVNVSAALIAELCRESKSVNLSKVVNLLEEHRADLPAFLEHHPQGRILVGYLRKLAGCLDEDRQANLAELETLIKNIDHIKQIVSMQQNVAKVSGVRERLRLQDLLEDALSINILSYHRHGIRVERRFEEVPEAVVDKHSVLQILINLMGNAKHALKEAEREDKVVTLGLGMSATPGRVWIRVADNGCGIAHDHLVRIFTHGFTTKKSGHGFGLHSGALAAKQMGGALRVDSAGKGQGAVFTLELPLGPVPDAAQAA